MAEITFNLNNGKFVRAKNAVSGTFPIEVGFTKAQWLRECMRRWLIHVVRDYERGEAIQVARDSITLEDDLLL